MTKHLARFFAVLGSLVKAIPLDTATEAIGLATVAFGVGLIYLPAGVIVAGLALCLVGYALGSEGAPTKAGEPE